MGFGKGQMRSMSNSANSVNHFTQKSWEMNFKMGKKGIEKVQIYLQCEKPGMCNWY